MEKWERNRLSNICINEGGRFFTILNGNVYCNLAFTRRVECKYCSRERDVNGLYTCNYSEYKHIRDELLYRDPQDTYKI